MEASKLVIDPKHLRFDKMPMAKRSKLRRENIKALIKSKPAGTVIYISEFQKATMSSNPATYTMLMNMVKKGQIIKIQDEKQRNRYSWAVPDAKVTTPKTPKTESPPTPRVHLEELTEQAKSYAWQKDSDSLRGFIEWMNNGQK